MTPTNPDAFVNSSTFDNLLYGTFTRYSELPDGSALLEEFRKEKPVSKLVYSEKFEAGTEDAADCIKVARKNSRSYNMLFC